MDAAAEEAAIEAGAVWAGEDAVGVVAEAVAVARRSATKIEYAWARMPGSPAVSTRTGCSMAGRRCWGRYDVEDELR